VGVLALQGDFLEHLLTFRRLGAEASEVRLPRDLAGVQALVIPGGESTTIARMLDLYRLREPILERVQAGMPIWGTCAGLILLAKELQEGRPEPLGLMDIRVARNAYGRQIDSFEIDLDAPALGEEPFHAVFIRAPRILEAADSVEVLARLPDGTPVAARQGSVLVSAFHPELTGDTRFHAYFLSMVAATAEARR
jgi:5'-phosphate synthase pdxT subunit